MLSILAPSKTLDFIHDAPTWSRSTPPEFIEDAGRIMRALRELDKKQLASLMSVSETIALVNHDRITEWGTLKKSALWAYRGDVYKGMYADQLAEADIQWAESHLRIMSGLYGVLRPLDYISPYRLEMKSKLRVGDAKDLYELWADKLARMIDSESGGVICNLSSEEYSKPVTKYSSSRIITPVFMDHKPNGKVGSVPIYSKMMRGVMARWMIDHRVNDPERLNDFDGFGYMYDASRSKPNAPAFVREVMKPLVF